jgi:hypothetical protein
VAFYSSEQSRFLLLWLEAKLCASNQTPEGRSRDAPGVFLSVAS